MNLDEIFNNSEIARAEVRKILQEVGESDANITDDLIDAVIPFAKLLVLPDETFENIAPYLLEAQLKNYNSYQTRAQLIEQVRVPGFDKNEQITAFATLLQGLLDGVSFQGTEVSEKKKDFCNSLLILFIDAINTAITHIDSVTIPIELTSENGRIPQFGHDGDAGADLYSTVEMDLGPGEQAIIPLDFKVQIPEGYAMLIQPRSGQSAKTKLRICNTPGLIDSGYRGVVGVLIENIDPPIRKIDSDYINHEDGGYLKVRSIDYGTSIHIDKGMRIAQARIVRVPNVNYIETKEVNDTERGSGGFGSTGTM